MPTIPECVIRPLVPSERSVRQEVLRSLRRLSLLVLGSASALLAQSCGDDEKKPDPFGIEGRYTMRTAAGQKLPALIHEETLSGPSGPVHVQIDANGGVLTLDDGGYTHQVDLGVYADGQPQPGDWNDRGVYEAIGDSVAFVSDLFETIDFSGRLDGADLVITAIVVGDDAAEPVSFRYTR